MSAFDDDTPLPPTRLLIRSREGLVTFQGPPSQTPEKGEVKATSDEGHGLKGVRGLRLAPKYSPDGNKVCLVKEAGQPIAIHDGSTGAFLCEVPVLEASLVEFSPQGTYLSTWQRPANAKDGVKAADNFIITRVSDGKVIGSFFQKAYKQDALQWTDDETICAHLVTNEVRFLKVSDSSLVPCGKCVHKGLSQYKMAPVPDHENGTYAVGVFTPEKGGKPASVNMYAWAGVESGQETAEGPKNTRTVFAASEATMLWNAQGNSLLVHTHSDVDKSNTSYYGATGLYVLTTSSAGNISEKINQSKDGPVYDVKWSPLGDKFCLAAGHMPSRSTLYNHKAQPLYEFGEAHRNTIIWAPHGRFVCVAGFGNLAGEMDFYDCVKMKKMGANISHCAVQYGWSPDSRYFMTATLAPRMNVDNGYKIFKYNGIGPISEEGYTQAFDAMWQPQPRSKYPDRGQSPRREGDAKPIKDVAELKQKESGGASAGAYRPPGARGMSNSLADKMRREAAPVGKVKAGSDGTTRSIGSMDVHKGAGMRFAPRTIPGMAAPAPTKNKVVSEEEKAAKKAREAEKKAAKKAAAEAASAPAPAPAPAPAAKSINEMTGEEKEKRAKAIKKKLKSIDELKANKAAGGAEMNEDQQAKLASEADLLSELKKLAV